MMQALKFILVAAAGLAATVGCGQNVVVLPPAPPTRLEMLETNTGKVVIKGLSLVGTLSISGAPVSVNCKEDIDTTTSRRLYGIAISIGTAPNEDRTILDDDELASMLDACDYFARIDWSVTSLSSFTATYLSRGGFRLSAFSSRRSDIIEFSLRSSRMERALQMSGTQLAQFRSLLDQARRKLDEIKAGGHSGN